MVILKGILNNCKILVKLIQEFSLIQVGNELRSKNLRVSMPRNDRQK